MGSKQKQACRDRYEDGARFDKIFALDNTDLKDSIIKCETFMSAMLQRRGAVRVRTDKLDPMARNDRKIFESSIEVDADDDEDEAYSQSSNGLDNEDDAMRNFDFQINHQRKGEASDGHAGNYRQRSNLLSLPIRVQALESDRSHQNENQVATSVQDIVNQAAHDKGCLASVRSGDDFDCDSNSKVSNSDLNQEMAFQLDESQAPSQNSLLIEEIKY